MTPDDFKAQWGDDPYSKWLLFNNEEIERSLVNSQTKTFLKNGFPDSAAPFLSFGWDGGSFLTITEYYKKDFALSQSHVHYWLLGSDGGGNPICIDSANNDRILLLDHESEFDVIFVINDNVWEFAECLLILKNAIDAAIDENTDMDITDSTFTTQQYEVLIDAMKQVGPNIIYPGGFWLTEINML